MRCSLKYLQCIKTIQEGITSLCVSSPNYSPERGGVGGLGPDTPLTSEPLDQSELELETSQPIREENEAWPGEECGGEARVKPHHQDSLKSSSPTKHDNPNVFLAFVLNLYLIQYFNTRLSFSVIGNRMWLNIYALSQDQELSLPLIFITQVSCHPENPR